jgi:hypothetical protein
MTLARRTALALCIALATALAVAGLGILDPGGERQAHERIRRD